MFAAVSSPFLARFFIVLPTRISACSFMLSPSPDLVLLQVVEDKGGLTGWDQPIQDGSIVQPSALHPSVCVFCFQLFRKCHHNTVLPTAKGQPGEILAAFPGLWAGHSPPAHRLLAGTDKGTESLTWEREEERTAGKCFHPALPLQPPHCTTSSCKAAAAQGSWRNILFLPRHASF